MLERLTRHLAPKKDLVPREGYDLWSQTYDQQPDNLMLALDEEVFSILMGNVSIKKKHVVDVGCGTGRHWQKLYAQQPASLMGYDVSAGMLEKLVLKYPAAVVRQACTHRLPELKDASCDLVMSTLTIAHIEELENAFAEWDRTLKKDGDIIITDYHPELLLRGGDRTFQHNSKTISVKNHIHSIKKILEISNLLGWEPRRLEERKIDDSVRRYYEQKNALHLFEKFKGCPVIFGVHLKNKYATT